MQHKLHLSHTHLETLYKHAEDSFPLEAAALLFGLVSGPSVIVHRIEPVHNEAKSSKISFMVNPEEQYHLLVEAEEEGLELVGIFHSHPAPPYPSKRDKENMKLNPVVWLIASKDTGNWASKAFLLEDEQIVEVDLRLS
ncbi:MAG: M67 family metallopeptidase [Candidatus Thorarchaeota archaeon]